MGLEIQIEHWKDKAAFKAHLSKHTPLVARWAQGIVLHHTWKPVPSQWHGMSTMEAICKYYERKGWTTTPHLFIVTGSTDSSVDGIWQMTPLNLQGTHAGAWNRTHWGIEVVGNYDTQGWREETKDLVISTMVELLRWRSINFKTSTVIGHRETGSKKTCPGSAIDMYEIRRIIQEELNYGFE